MSDTNTPNDTSKPLTFTYKNINGSSPILLDVYPPRCSLTAVPAVVYFHGGGLTVGNKSSWFPYWLEERVTKSGLAFISVDYRLLPPSTGHEIIEDVKDLFRYLALDLNPRLQEQLVETGESFQVDPNAIAVAGTSAGGLCAYLAVIHAMPRPKALLGLYAMGGDFALPQYLEPKTSVFFRGRELLDPQTFTEYLPPECRRLEPTSDSPLSYHPPTAPIPGYPANPRMLLARLYLQLGNFLDIYAGSPGLSDSLRTTFSSVSPCRYHPNGDPVTDPMTNDTLTQELYRISPKDIPLFPQLHVNSSWPSCLLVHGSADSAVRVEETYHMCHLLRNANVPVTLKVLPDREHSFDYAPDAHSAFGGDRGLFDEIQTFLVNTLRGS